MTTTAALDQTKIAAARLWAVNRQPYLARAVFACVARPEAGSGTIGVGRSWQFEIDPQVLGDFEPPALGRLMLHLIGHLIRDHAARAETICVERDQQRARWNRCADAELNDDLQADGCVPDVACDMPSDLGVPTGQLAESYYRAARDGPRRWDCGAGADASAPRPKPAGDSRATSPDHSIDGLSGAQAELLRLAVASDIQQQNATEPGSIAAGWRRWAEAVLPSRVDWRRALAAEIRSAIASTSGAVDYSYRRPSRRSRSVPRVVMPTMQRPVPEIAVVCDTSGSMHEDLLARALAEIDAILTGAGLRAAGVRVLAVDTTVHTLRRVSRAAQVQLAGGGGTDMGAGIAAAAALRPRPSTIVVLTDGYTPWPDHPPPRTRIVVGILREDEGESIRWEPPAWARTVLIHDAL